MVVLSQDSVIAVDCMAVELQNIVNSENGDIIGIGIVVFGFGVSFTVAKYGSEGEARAMFLDIMKAWSSGQEFYDVRAREKKVLKVS